MIAALRHFHGTFLSGWWRRPTEHFTVFAGPMAGPLVPVRAPFGSYYADPFIRVHQDEPWLFLEEFRFPHNRGRLVARRLSGGPVLPITLAGPGHASFPCVFAAEGQLFLLPETGNTGTLDLYVCERFPDRWRLVRRLADNLDAADTVPLRHDGRWWFITSVRRSRSDGGHRSLAIFHTEDLLGGALTAHPVNTERRHAASPYSSGRNAGAIIPLPDGQLLRPVHASQRYYGENMGWNRIDELSPAIFRETSLDTAPACLAALPRLPLHHVSAHEGWLACDTRDRVPFGLKPPADSPSANAARTR